VNVQRIVQQKKEEDMYTYIEKQLSDSCLSLAEKNRRSDKIVCSFVRHTLFWTKTCVYLRSFFAPIQTYKGED